MHGICVQGLADAAKQQLNTYQSKLSRARETLKQGLHVALGQQFGEDEDEYQNNLAQHETVSTQGSPMKQALSYGLLRFPQKM